MNNIFLADEQLIIDKLNEIPDVNVFSMVDLSGLNSKAQFAPLIHLNFEEARVIDERGDGAVIKMQKIWGIYIVVRLLDVSNLHSSAGRYVSLVIEKLAGKKMSPDFTALKLSGPIKSSYQNGFYYLKLQFSNSMIMRSE